MQPSAFTLRALRRVALQAARHTALPSTRTIPKASPFNSSIARSAAFSPRFSRPYSSASDSTEVPRRPLTQAPEGEQPEAAPRQPRPEYQLTFTCKPCSTRSKHTITKQAYHYGAVLVQCPECKNRHVIADHLGIFLDKKMTIEDLMREKGQLVKKGSLGADGDLEFWPETESSEGQPTPELGSPSSSPSQQ